MSLSATIKSIQDIMRKDAGVDGDAQRVGQLGWLLFYKIFSDLELQTELLQDDYTSPVPARLRWETWADEIGLDSVELEIGSITRGFRVPAFDLLLVGHHELKGMLGARRRTQPRSARETYRHSLCYPPLTINHG